MKSPQRRVLYHLRAADACPRKTLPLPEPGACALRMVTAAQNPAFTRTGCLRLAHGCLPRKTRRYPNRGLAPCAWCLPAQNPPLPESGHRLALSAYPRKTLPLPEPGACALRMDDCPRKTRHYRTGCLRLAHSDCRAKPAITEPGACALRMVPARAKPCLYPNRGACALRMDDCPRKTRRYPNRGLAPCAWCLPAQNPLCKDLFLVRQQSHSCGIQAFSTQKSVP